MEKAVVAREEAAAATEKEDIEEHPRGGPVLEMEAMVVVAMGPGAAVMAAVAGTAVPAIVVEPVVTAHNLQMIRTPRTRPVLRFQR